MTIKPLTQSSRAASASPDFQSGADFMHLAFALDTEVHKLPGEMDKRIRVFNTRLSQAPQEVQDSAEALTACGLMVEIKYEFTRTARPEQKNNPRQRMEAEAYFRQALQRSPDYVPALILLARIMIDMKEVSKALDCMAQVYEIYNRRGQTFSERNLEMLADIYNRQKKYAMAEACYDCALTLTQKKFPMIKQAHRLLQNKIRDVQEHLANTPRACWKDVEIELQEKSAHVIREREKASLSSITEIRALSGPT